MQTNPASAGAAASAEEAVIQALILLGRRMRQRFPGDEIDFSAIPVLRALEHQGPSRVSVLAGHLGLDASTVSRHVRQLEDRGLLERAGDPDDGRASQVMLSGRGRDCLEQGAASRRALVATALGGWSDVDRESLRSLLVRLCTDLENTPAPQENP